MPAMAFQPRNKNLSSIASLMGASNKLVGFSGPEVATLFTVGATVRFRKPGTIGVGRLTNVSGIATDTIDDGTWTLIVTKTLYTGTPATVTVDGDETINYSLTAVDLPDPTTPDTTTAYAYVYDMSGVIVSAARVGFQLLAATNSSGIIYDGSVAYSISDSDGLVTAQLLKNSSYRATFRKSETTFTTGSASTFPIPEIIG